MKIVILNECFLKENHLDRLYALGELEIYSDTDTEEKTKTRLKGADIAIADPFVAKLNKNVLLNLDQLKLLALNTTGYDLVDIENAAKKNIKVAHIPNFSTDAVAEHVIALIFGLIRKIPISDKTVRDGLFEVDPGNIEHRNFLTFNLKDKILGVVGLGKIGQRVAQLGIGLGMQVIAYNRSEQKIDNVRLVKLEELLKTSDVISLNLAFSPELENFISAKELDLMKPSAVLINTARGKLINSNDLAAALKEKKISGASLDTLDNNNLDNPLLKLDNIILTPHSAWFTQESLDNMADLVCLNVENFIHGNPSNIVN
jgi:lactate dehydrogenase-like 2-hydroxyacid dehydrogenase